MGWELVDTQPDGTRVFIDGVFRLTITHIVTINIHEYCWSEIDGKPVPIKLERDHYKLWNGAQYVGPFGNREDVARVVSQLREKNMNNRRR